MTITYPNGTVRTALLLTHGEHELRAMAPDCDDVLIFTRIQGTWISDDLEPVTFQFEWQRRVPTSAAAAEEDYICSRELADQLIATLFPGPEPTPRDADNLYVFTPQGNRVPIRRKDLVPN